VHTPNFIVVWAVARCTLMLLGGCPIHVPCKQVNSESVVFILLLGASTTVFSYFSRSWPCIADQSKGLLFSCLALGLHFVTHYLQKTELDERSEPKNRYFFFIFQLVKNETGVLNWPNLAYDFAQQKRRRGGHMK
jgi:hypothetical protein